MPGTFKRGPKRRSKKRNRKTDKRPASSSVLVSLDRLTQERGQDAETCVMEVLQEAEKIGVVRQFWRATQFSAWDRMGYDFVIELANARGIAFPIQVKSSRQGATEFRLRGSADARIPIFVARPHEYRQYGILARRFVREIVLPCREAIRRNAQDIQTLTIPLAAEEAALRIETALALLCRTDPTPIRRFRRWQRKSGDPEPAFQCLLANGKTIKVTPSSLPIPYRRRTTGSLKMRSTNQGAIYLAIAPSATTADIINAITAILRAAEDRA